MLTGVNAQFSFYLNIKYVQYISIMILLDIVWLYVWQRYRATCLDTRREFTLCERNCLLLEGGYTRVNNNYEYDEETKNIGLRMLFVHSSYSHSCN